ncbi:MAG: hypothetical protein DLM53_03140 [Candidatus Eremiobacter antarcticus]|nr:class I SAM-dependent methyltransferase [Candidatus Eremiobacteraeota bacterium]MBC5808408.1 class I SAM-dependent methyltransferase [Candidatus Eremiobacteraeota bacterium]PZR63769.1 MAG: hypothetical protein DLM53_03140 [Candidatus Eremiobacter sp. RRmetagenome_bin22]
MGADTPRRTLPLPDASKNPPLRLLPAGSLVTTGPVDHADWNFRPLIGTLSRLRFKAVVALLGSRRMTRLLEIGYGSGIFLPELARHCDELYGLDIHSENERVASILHDFSVQATLMTGSATDLPFPACSFDCVVCVSALEFIDDLPRACDEIARVLEPGGSCIVVTPAISKLLDLALLLATGQDASDDFKNRRERILPELQRRFTVVRRRKVPSFVPGFRLYTSLELVPLRGASAG